jgi:hypothetical protein
VQVKPRQNEKERRMSDAEELACHQQAHQPVI